MKRKLFCLLAIPVLVTASSFKQQQQQPEIINIKMTKPGAVDFANALRYASDVVSKQHVDLKTSNLASINNNLFVTHTLDSLADMITKEYNATHKP